jgi:hypothetical protein
VIAAPVTTAADITKAAITSISGITANNKTYDGTTGATLNTSGASFNGMIAGDNLSVALATGAFVDKNAGTNKTVGITGLSLGGTDAGNYVYSGTATTTADIAKAAITAITGITANNKTYDCTTVATLNTSGIVFNGMITGDSLSLASAMGAFSDKSAGINKTVTVSGLTLGGTDAGNYALSSPISTTTADISQAALTFSGFTVQNKTYDGTTAATIVNAGTLGGVVSGDVVSFTYGNVAFSDKNAATGKIVTLNGITLAGTDSDNYTIAGTATTSADIAKATITTITGITAANKTYDGTTIATLNTSGAVFTGMITGDSLSLAAAAGAFIDKNAGTNKTVTVSGLILGGTDARNYTLSSTNSTTNADIAKAAITTITGIMATNKTYDGTTIATLNTSGAVFNGMIAGDSLSIASSTGAFVDKNAGTNKTVAVSGLSLGGTDAGNYTLVSATSTTTADIAKAVITAITDITANNKTYDGTMIAMLNTSGATFNGMIAGDSLSVASAAGTFVDKNAGTNKTVAISGLSLGGTDAGNYSLASTTGTTSADIARAALTLSDFTVQNKTYDGTTAATVVNAGALGGILPGDSVSFGYGNASFSDKNAAANKTVTLNGVALAGAEAGNYMITGSVTTSADITKAVITTISGITANNKTYDGTTIATLNSSGAIFNGMIVGDQLVVATAVGTFENAVPGRNKPVAIIGLTLAGADAGNYRLADTTAATRADITSLPPWTFFPYQRDWMWAPSFGSPMAGAFDSTPELIETSTNPGRPE